MIQKSRIQSFRQLLTPGINIKRWLFLLGIGALAMGVGFYSLLTWLYQADWLPNTFYQTLTLQFLPNSLRVILPLIIGVLVVFLALKRMGISLIAPFGPREQPMAEMLYTHSRRRRGPRIVAIGGGTGMPSLLRGLRQFTDNITAIVTVADDGGSSGRLRREFGLLPPGDFRNNIAALSRDEALMTQVLQYRFGGSVTQNGSGELKGHAFGNLLLAALTGITGSFDEALLAAERVLAMRGRVLPSTLEDVALVADIVKANGDVERVMGESAIPKVNGRIQQISLHPETIRAYPPTLQAILQADIILMGPGSLYTSILPNLLIPDLIQAIQKTRAPKLYICNLATQPGETDNYNVAKHVESLLKHIPTACLDFVLANDNLSVPTGEGGGNTIYVEPIALAATSVKMITADLVDEKRPWRHDSNKLAQIVMQILENN